MNDRVHRILITGGCGKIGAHFAKYAAHKYHLRVVDKIAWDEARLGPLAAECIVADLQDLNACRAACEGIDMVVHLAADPDPDAEFYDSLLGNNIVATYNMFRAAKDAGCARFIYASSVHTVAAYPPDVQIKSGMAVRPKNMYGVSKCFGEAVAAYYAYNQGLPGIVLRIGAYVFPDAYERFSLDEIDAFLDPDDLNQLLVACIETPDITFAIAHAISDNRYKRLDLSETRQVFGYRPGADAFEIFHAHPDAPWR